MSYPAYAGPQPYPPDYTPQQYPMYPPAGHQPYYAQQPQVIYRDCPHQQRPSRWNDPNTCWLISLLTLCCGCFVGQQCCDSNLCCCLIPCALPRFR